jgi:uncharacterized repeat protein (TIGR01451 family)
MAAAGTVGHLKQEVAVMSANGVVPVVGLNTAGHVRRAVLLSVLVLAMLWPASSAGASPAAFGTGTLIIPMDVGPDGQDAGALRAYGLVYELLRNGVPVQWAISPAKAAGGADFSLAGGTVTSLGTGSAVSLPRPYRGGPFLIRSADRAAALPIVEAWLAAPGDTTSVHNVVAGSFTAEIARTLVAAPRIGVLEDGDQAIAFENLNAAGIRDSTGASWNMASPDLLSEPEVAGPTTGSAQDGALFGADGLPRYCQLMAMHYNLSPLTEDVVHETRSWLAAGPLTHALLQCEAIRTFENAAAGRFLTTDGIADDGSAPSIPALHLPSDPLSQLDGPFAVDSGAVDSIGLAAGSSFRTGVRTLVSQQSSPAGSRIAWLSGRMDGIGDNGAVSYLAGHDYSRQLPISANPQTNGVRLLLNGLFEALCAAIPLQPDVALSMTAPAETSASAITYTLTYSNPGPRRVENLRIVDELPPGATFVSASGGGTHAGGVVSWSLGSLDANAGGSLAVTVSPAAHGSYRNVASAEFAHLAVRKVVSNEATTKVRTGRLSVPGPVDFGAQAKSTVGSVRTLLVRNPAPPANGDSVTVGRLQVRGEDFLIADDGCSGAVLDGSESCAVSLRFAPADQGERTGSLLVISDAIDGPYRIALRGFGTPAPGAVRPPAAQPKLMLAIAPGRLRVRSGQKVRLRFVISSAAALRLDVKKGRKRVGRVAGTARPGRGTLTWNAKVQGRRARPGRYRLVLVATDRAGHTARDSIPLAITRARKPGT